MQFLLFLLHKCESNRLVLLHKITSQPCMWKQINQKLVLGEIEKDRPIFESHNVSYNDGFSFVNTLI